MPVYFLQVAEDEGEDPIELPTEEDDTLLLSTVVAQFPGASGLKYKATPESKTYRGVRLADGILYPPPDDGWDSKVFICVFPKENKRKNDDTVESSAAKKRLETKLSCTDLIVLGLPWKTTDAELKEYFETFGEMLVAQVKTDKEGRSKGYGFIRFAKYDSQMRVLALRHMIGGRWCDVKVPSSKEGVIPQLPRRVFVGRCTEDMSVEDLKNYFGKFGEVTDVFMPKPFRAFCFVTFLNPEVAHALCGEDHIIKGVSVHVSTAAPPSEMRKLAARSDRDGDHDNKGGPVWGGNKHGGPDSFNSGPNRGNWGNSGGPGGPPGGLGGPPGGLGGPPGGPGGPGGRIGNMDMSGFGPLMNPAFVAAALSQAGWTFMGNKQDSNNFNQGGGFNNGGGPGPNRRNQNGGNDSGGSSGGPGFNPYGSWGGGRPQNREFFK